MNRDYESTWTCLHCQWENPEDDFCCSQCRELKPVECCLCGELFQPWSESRKGNGKIIKDLCMDCFYLPEEDEEETEQDRIDAAGDELYHSMREDGEL